MVTEQLVRRGITDPLVLQAMAVLPRHAFVPDRVRPSAYDDCALGIWEGQTISQPYIVATMTQALRLAPGNRVLEVGTGSGYQTAVLAEIVDLVDTIEILPGLAERARHAWEHCGCAERIRVRIGDGHAGWPEHAPYDAIVVTCAPQTLPLALVHQMAPLGRLVIPTGATSGDQELQLIEKDAHGAIHTSTMMPVRFVRMIGPEPPSSRTRDQR